RAVEDHGERPSNVGRGYFAEPPSALRFQGEADRWPIVLVERGSRAPNLGARYRGGALHEVVRRLATWLLTCGNDFRAGWHAAVGQRLRCRHRPALDEFQIQGSCGADDGFRAIDISYTRQLHENLIAIALRGDQGLGDAQFVHAMLN